MNINQLAKDHIEFCKKKGLPVEMKHIIFLTGRVVIEANEALVEVNKIGGFTTKEKLQEELVDVFLQTIQALYVIDSDIESAIKKKQEINNKRTWNSKEQ